MKKSLLLFLLSLYSIISFAQQKTKVAPRTSGKQIYTQRCMTCHQVDGAGAQNMIPPLIKTSYVTGNKQRLIKILLNGLNGQITVKGEMYEGEMPPQNFLSDREIAAVLTYVRSSFGNKAGPVTTGEVKNVRASIKKKKKIV